MANEKKPVAHRTFGRGELAALLTVAQVAERLGLSRPTIYAMIRRGQLPSSKIGGCYYVAPSAVDALLPPSSTSNTHGHD